ncbi:MAG: DNA polymerase III subunit delta [Egibacteraceae bacterium]
MASRPPMYLVAGPEELLLRRAAERILDELRAGGALEVIDVRAADLGDGGLPDLRTASLFGTPRAVLVRGAQELPAGARAALLSELSGSPPEATVILLATGTGPIQTLAKRIKALGGRIDVLPPKDWEEAAWARLVADEFGVHGRGPDRGAVQAILAHAGLDVAAIAEKVAQACATAPPGTVTAAQVERVVVGHGSRGSFAVADAMCERDAARALRLLRGVLDSGDHPVMVLAALVYRLRSIVAVAAKVDAKAIGLSTSPGQARRLNTLRRNFGPGELTRAYQVLAAADLALKSGGLPGELILERTILDIATPAR